MGAPYACLLADLMGGLGFRGGAAAAVGSRCPDAWQWKRLLITHCICMVSCNYIAHSGVDSGYIGCSFHVLRCLNA